MVDHAADIFSRYAQIYDRSRRQLIPCFDDFYAAALAPLAFGPDSKLEILDLGAGTGLLSLFVAHRFPKARLTLVDASEDMLKLARERFAKDIHRFDFLRSDYAAEALAGPYDAVVSALSIHHLTHDDKRSLFRKIFASLNPGGVFVNADQVEGETAEEEMRFRRSWLEKIRAAGTSEQDLAAAKERMKADKMAPLNTQLQWLAEAGFSEERCSFQDDSFVVYSGRKSP